MSGGQELKDAFSGEIRNTKIYRVTISFDDLPGIQIKAASYEVLGRLLYFFDEDNVAVATFNDWVYVSLLTDP